jgi:hypothetical protein
MVKSKFPIITLLFVFVMVTAHAQDLMQNIFDPKAEITWLGVDLSRAKFIGDRERWGSTSDVQRIMEAWNDLIVKEKDKFNIARALGKEKGTVKNMAEVTKESNTNLDVTEMFSNEKSDHVRLRPDDIVAVVSEYDFKDASGLGLMFNVESFSKLDAEAAIWVTFINIGNKEVLFSERVTGQPGGMGMRNFWANSVFEVLEKMKKKEFEMWRKKYYRK